MMEDEDLFSVLSRCFAPVDRDEWEGMSTGPAWSDFLDAARRGLQPGHVLGVSASPIAAAHPCCPLQEFLSAGEVSALFCPPTYDEKQAFAARHFTGGLPTSALPIESLYEPWTRGATTPFSRCDGLYLGDSALYMRDLVQRLGLSVPEAFCACPDHLSLELDLLVLLIRSGMQKEAQLFFTERFAWLATYRAHLLAHGTDASFYIGLIDVMVGMWAQTVPTEMSA